MIPQEERGARRIERRARREDRRANIPREERRVERNDRSKDTIRIHTSSSANTSVDGSGDRAAFPRKRGATSGEKREKQIHQQNPHKQHRKHFSRWLRRQGGMAKKRVGPPLAASFGDLWLPLLGYILCYLFSLLSSLLSLLSSLFTLLSSLFFLSS